jgi:hypothetical protein
MLLMPSKARRSGHGLPGCGQIPSQNSFTASRPYKSGGARGRGILRRPVAMLPILLPSIALGSPSDTPAPRAYFPITEAGSDGSCPHFTGASSVRAVMPSITLPALATDFYGDNGQESPQATRAARPVVSRDRRPAWRPRAHRIRGRFAVTESARVLSLQDLHLVRRDAELFSLAQ